MNFATSFTTLILKHLHVSIQFRYAIGSKMKTPFSVNIFLLASLIASSSVVAATDPHQLPQIDLGYAIYRPTNFNVKSPLPLRTLSNYE